MASIDGIVSGFNTAQIISGLVSIQQRQIDQFTGRKTEIARRQTAFRGVEARLATLRSTMSRLNRSLNGVFDARTVTSSDETRVTATASNGAQTGVTAIRVNSLAASHQTATQGFAAATSEITTGTIAIQTGNREAETITIDSTRNTLQGLADAINSQSRQVSASLIRDSATGQYRLLMASKNSGTENAITVTNNLGPDSGGAIRPDFNNQVIQAAANSSITIGSGAGAITSEFQTNRVDGLIAGVTLNLLQADPTRTISVAVKADDSQVGEAVQEFVDDYNDLIKYLNDQTSYVAETGTAGLLLGNRPVAGVRDRLERLVTGTVPGLTTGLRRLSQIGVTIGDKGTLTFSQSKLDNILAGQDSEIDPSEVRNLFGLNASSTSGGVQFVLGSSKTTTDLPVEVDITQAATQARMTAKRDLAETIVIDGTNREFSFKLDGKASGTLQLTEGTYTRAQLASHLQSVINGASALAGRDVAVTLNGDKLEIISQSWGSASTISELAGTAIDPLGFDSGDLAVGQDVVGRFLVDGQIETAVGTGRLLVGSAGNQHTADLQVRVTLGNSQVTSGVEATLNITRGLTARLDQTLADLLDPDKGLLSTVDDQYDDQIAVIDKSIARVEAITAAKREYLTLQFANLERLLGQLQTTSAAVSAQLGSISVSRNR